MCNNESHFFLFFFITDYPKQLSDMLYGSKEDDDLYLFTGNDKAQNERREAMCRLCIIHLNHVLPTFESGIVIVLMNCLLQCHSRD